jgi:hypothetical protein
MKSNPTVCRSVYVALYRAVGWAGAVDDAVRATVYRDVDWVVHAAVYWAVSEALDRLPPVNPALVDFLAAASAEAA